MCIAQKLPIFKFIFEFIDSFIQIICYFKIKKMTDLTEEDRNILVNEYDQFRFEKGWHNENTTPLTVFHGIKGYHHFRIRPLTGSRMKMLCIREPQNVYDRYAVKIVIPLRQELSPDILDEETSGEPRRQLVHDIAGKTVGCVPRDISQIISEGIRTGQIRRSQVIFTGIVKHEGPVLGGGVILMGAYHFEIVNNESVKQDIINKFNIVRQSYLL